MLMAFCAVRDVLSQQRCPSKQPVPSYFRQKAASRSLSLTTVTGRFSMQALLRLCLTYAPSTGYRRVALPYGSNCRSALFADGGRANHSVVHLSPTYLPIESTDLTRSPHLASTTSVHCTSVVSRLHARHGFAYLFAVLREPSIWNW